MKTYPTVQSLLRLGLILASSICANAAHAAALPAFDFTDPAVCAQWGQPHHLSALRHTSEGLELTISGLDPYFSGPPRDYGTNALWMDLKLRSETGGGGQIFWFTQQATEENSQHFRVIAGEWNTIRLALPPLGKNCRLRIDPPGTNGRCILASVRFSAQPDWRLPAFPKLTLMPENAAPWIGKTTAVRPVTTGWGGFEVGRSTRLAVPHNGTMIGYMKGEKPFWFAPGGSVAKPSRKFTPGRDADIDTSTAIDPDGGRWTIVHQFRKTNGVFNGVVETTVSVNQDREVLFLPLVFLAWNPGNTNKTQAIFPGLEYLDNEPSSSEADLIGAASKRQVPDPVKITQPYITMLGNLGWLSFGWEPNPQLATFFDSPDRTFGTGGHVMGLVFPGFINRGRTDGHWLPNQPARLKANEKVTAKVLVNSGTEDNLQPAMADYVRRHGFPPMPSKTPAWQEYANTAIGGWLDSKDREGNLFRHAVWQGFNPQPAADAAVYMEWLACQSEDPAVLARLTNTAAQVLSAVPPAQWAFAEVSHIRMPLPPLVFGHVAENQRQAHAQAEHLSRRFTSAGFVPYVATPSKEDYGRTYHTNHANGLTAQVTSTLLESAVFSGDEALIDEALRKVRALKTLYHNSVPRGAQTWECPLHTPDILASAYLLRATALAWKLTGEKEFFDEATYWAWTGVPFVYLVDPVEREVGRYGTIAVFGATGWKAPVWMGLPVQWCGLVYADALYRFGGEAVLGMPWQKLADGITAAGIQMTWPLTDKERQGLLPDSFILQDQLRDGPAINPGTLQPCAARFYKRTPLYDCQVLHLPAARHIIHAPGQIMLEQGSAPKSAFAVNLWPRRSAWVLITGIKALPTLKINSQKAEVSAPHEYDPATGSLRLQLQGQAKVEIQ